MTCNSYALLYKIPLNNHKRVVGVKPQPGEPSLTAAHSNNIIRPVSLYSKYGMAISLLT